VIEEELKIEALHKLLAIEKQRRQELEKVLRQIATQDVNADSPEDRAWEYERIAERTLSGETPE
jgi:hypothetical protein